MNDKAILEKSNNNSNKKICTKKKKKNNPGNITINCFIVNQQIARPI